MFNHIYRFYMSFARRLSFVGVAYTYCQNKLRGLFAATDYAVISSSRGYKFCR